MANLLSDALGAHAAELVMFERAGCPFRARFDAEVGRIYAKTDEGAGLPIRPVNVGEARPAGVAQIEPGPFTPTFVMLEGGREIGRIRGYPGEENFHGYLDSILRDIDRGKFAAAAP